LKKIPWPRRQWHVDRGRAWCGAESSGSSCGGYDSQCASGQNGGTGEAVGKIEIDGWRSQEFPPRVSDVDGFCIMRRRNAA